MHGTIPFFRFQRPCTRFIADGSTMHTTLHSQSFLSPPVVPAPSPVTCSIINVASSARVFSDSTIYGEQITPEAPDVVGLAFQRHHPPLMHAPAHFHLHTPALPHDEALTSRPWQPLGGSNFTTTDAPLIPVSFNRILLASFTTHDPSFVPMTAPTTILPQPGHHLLTTIFIPHLYRRGH